jgi:hypothetical protein
MNEILLVVTGLSLLLAGFMSAFAWRMSREERRRSDTRIAALSSAIYEDVDDEAELIASRLFEEPAASSTARFGVAAGVGACAVAAIAGLTLMAARSTHREPVRAAVARTQPSEAPLELLALEHERNGNQLTVRGMVRNPAEAAERDGLAAVVLLFGRDGTFISTGRAAVPAAKLVAGATAPFVVTVPGATDVDRFRLSFRTDARIEPHVDRRTHADADKDLAP